MPGAHVSFLSRLNSFINRPMGIPVGVAACAVAALIAFCCFLSSNESNRWVIVLYLLPALVQVGGLVMLSGRLSKVPHDSGERRALEGFALFYVVTTFTCSIGYMGLSAVYIWKETFDHWTEAVKEWPKDGSLVIYSYSALTLICILLIMSVVMTWAVVSGSLIRNGKEVGVAPETGAGADGAAASGARDFGPLDKLKTGAAQEPFLILLFFFTVFLGISHLFGLALAFHDKDEFKSSGGRNPALYMRSISAAPTLGTTPTPTPASIPTPVPAAPAAPVIWPTPVAAFDFVPASALLVMDDPPPVSSENDEGYKKRYRKERADGAGVYAKMSDLAQKILDAADGHARARVEIVGHSDKQDLKEGGAYKSNQELAEARAENVRYRIMKELAFMDKGQWHDVEWFCVAESNEGGNNKRIVEVFVRQVPNDPASSQVPRLESQLLPLVNSEQPRPLDLMDYVYFANYTITTTGYGDIIPNTPRSKFICSFANICEVFFLVVLFNTLLTLKQDKNEMEVQQARDAIARKEIEQLAKIKEAVSKDPGPQARASEQRAPSDSLSRRLAKAISDFFRVIVGHRPK